MDIKVEPRTAIVFDLDDTLYNEVDFLRSAYVEISKRLEPGSWQQLFANLFARYRNKTDVFEYVVDTYGVSKNELLDLYRNHIPTIQPFEGVIDLLKQIKNKRGKIGIITDGRTITQKNKMKALGLTSYIDYSVISEEIGSEKPNENNYTTVENKLDCESYYYIADNLKKDFVTPKRLGWQTIALIDNGLNIHSNAHEYQKPEFLPNYFISSIMEIKVS